MGCVGRLVVLTASNSYSNPAQGPTSHQPGDMTPARPRPLFSSKKDATPKVRKMALKGDAFRSRLNRSKAVSILEEEKRKRQKAERARSQGKQYTLEKLALKAYASKAGLPPLKRQALHDRTISIKGKVSKRSSRGISTNLRPVFALYRRNSTSPSFSPHRSHSRLLGHPRSIREVHLVGILPPHSSGQHPPDPARS